MPIYAQDNLDDTTLDVGAPGFTGCDVTTKASLLPDTVLQRALNVYVDEQGLVLRRPAFVTVVPSPSPSAPVRGAALYDIPGKDSLVVLRGGHAYDYDPASGSCTQIANVTYGDSGAYAPAFAQLVTTLFRTASGGGNGLAFQRFDSGAWSVGVVGTFKDGSAMPAFGALCAHRFRLFAARADGDEVFPSDILDAATPTHWNNLSSIRVGTGEGDPIVAMVSYQENLLLVLKEASVWLVDTTDIATPANWDVRKLTGLVGCSCAKSVVQIGQDVLFMSRHGVVSIGALVQQNSVSPATTISAPIRNELIAGRAVWGGRWREFYLLGWDSTNASAMSAADRIWAYNTQTKAWVGVWTAAFDNSDAPAWLCPALVRPGGVEATVLCDTSGRVVQLDNAFDRTTDRTTLTANQTIPFEVITKAWNFDAPMNWKNLHRLEVEFFRQDLSEVSVALVVDGGDPEPIRTLATFTAGSFPFTLPFRFAFTAVFRCAVHLRPLLRRRVREVAVRVSGSGLGRLSLRGVTLSAFADTSPLQ